MQLGIIPVLSLLSTQVTLIHVEKKSALKVHGLEFSKIQNKDLAGSVSRN